MAKKTIALEWDERELRVVVSTAKGKSIEVEEAIPIPLTLSRRGSSHEENGAEEEVAEASLGEQLEKAWKKHRLPKGEVSVAIGRAQVELKQLSLPPVPDDELPELVRFQAMRESPQSVDEETPLDFVPLTHDPTINREVLAASISSERLEKIRAACHQAGLKLERLILRPFAAASFLRRQWESQTPQTRLFVDLLPEEVDLVALSEGRVVFLRTARLRGDQLVSQAETCRPLLSEIRRTIAAVHNQLSSTRIESIELCGTEATHQPLADKIQEATNLPVNIFDPFEEISLRRSATIPAEEKRGRFAALFGIGSDHAEERDSVFDFLHPRKKPEPPSKKQTWVLAAVAAALVVVVGGWFLWQYQADLDQQIAELQAQSSDLDPLVDKARERKAQRDLIADWVDREIIWLDELQRLAEKLPESEKLMITQLSASLDREDALLELEGLTDGSAVAGQLTGRLRDDHHRVNLRSGQADTKSPRYNWRFKSSVALEPLPKEAYRTIETQLNEDGEPIVDGAATPNSGEPATASKTNENESSTEGTRRPATNAGGNLR
ncbi:Hypothetical protein PBC10988_27960 [Planctomycetales bacterium 10988]|nr:Hypothetical protein PBC10988_27960 [Planctomycetales bacterium 10988]